MAARVKAIVKPELLVWARKSMGFSLEVAAKKIGVKLEQLSAWESGESAPTIPQLRKIAQIYKRPLAVFYLPEPPRTFDAMRDFRRLSADFFPEHSPELNLEIRRARMRREVTLDLYEQLGYDVPQIDFQIKLTDDPEACAQQARHLLGITLNQQVGWRDRYEALNTWIGALEAHGILVFQTSAIDLKEMRGFSIGEAIAPVIVANAKDSPRGRIFTLLHEFAHTLLRVGGLCDLQENGHARSEEQRVETFCNQVAASTLVVRSAFLQESLVASKGGDDGWTDEELQSLAQRYSVSQEVILRRLVTLGKASPRFYQKKREEFLEAYERESERQKAGSAPFYRVVVRNLGKSYIRLVLEAYYREAISSADLSDYLGVRLKYLPRLEEVVIRSRS